MSNSNDRKRKRQMVEMKGEAENRSRESSKKMSNSNDRKGKRQMVEMKGEEESRSSESSNKMSNSNDRKRKRQMVEMKGEGENRSRESSKKMSNSNDGKGKRQMVKMKGEGENRSRESSKSFCNICMDMKPTADMFKGRTCRHPFCNNCMSKHVTAKIQQNILNVKCPFVNCDVHLKPENVRSILPQKVFDRWQNAVLESTIPATQKCYCPFKDCSVLLIRDNAGQVVTSSECPYCHRLFCASCMVSWHAKLTCEEFQKLKRNKKNDDMNRKMEELAKKKNWQRCSKCSIYVDRSSGCEHMTCRCGHHFCYICGSHWAHGHVCKRT